MVEVIMPPTMGAAIGFMTSEPTPDSQRIGTRLASTAVTVISLGRSRCTTRGIIAISRSVLPSGSPVRSRIQRFMQIDGHDDARLDRNPEQRDTADPHGDA